MHSNLSILVPTSSLNRLSSHVLSMLQPPRSSTTISLNLTTALHRISGSPDHSHLLPSMHQNLIIHLTSKVWRPSSRVCLSSPRLRTLDTHVLGGFLFVLSASRFSLLFPMHLCMLIRVVLITSRPFLVHNLRSQAPVRLFLHRLLDRLNVLGARLSRIGSSWESTASSWEFKSSTSAAFVFP
jgi:hypothetical protein